MARRSIQDNDSLWLLLDTICNAFGGILLIALLFAILAREIRIAKPSPELEETLLQTDHRVAEAELTNSVLKTELRALTIRTTAWGQIVNLSNDCISISRNIANLNSMLASNRWALNHVAEIASNRMSQLLTLKEQIRDKTNTLAVVALETAELNNTLAQVESCIMTNEVRFPKEHETGKVARHVILRYNQVFLTYDPTNKKNHVNTTGLRWSMPATNQFIVAPIDGRGTAATDPVLLDKLKALNTERAYLVCWVYADSFAAFGQFKDQLQQLEIEYGWTPVELEHNISLTMDKLEPPPPE